MTRRLQTVIYDADTAPDIELFYGGHTIAATADRDFVHRTVILHAQTSRLHRYRMRPAVSGFFDATDTTAIVRQAIRGGHLVREWAAIELLFDQVTGTTVEARLHDGTDSYFWNGGAWVVAGAADWNVPQDVGDNFAALDPAIVPRVGVEWRLQTSDKRATPFVYGALIAARLLFMVRFQAQGVDGPDELVAPSATGSDGWTDDVIHRVLLPFLRDQVAPEVTDQRKAKGPLITLRYDQGVGDSAYVVDDVQAVYDLDVDPDMRTPLAGTWDPGTKVFTLTAAIPSGHTYAARLEHRPVVAYTANRDFFTARLPALLVESIAEVDDQPGEGDDFVRDPVAGTTLAVSAGRWKTYSTVILAQGDSAVSVFELVGALERAFDGRRGITLVSPGTGMQVIIHGAVRLRPARAGAAVPDAVRFDLRLRTREYHGAERTVTLLSPTGFIPQVGFGRDVLTTP